MIDLNIDDYKHKNQIEHDILEREINKLKEEIRNLKIIITYIKEKIK